MDWIVFGRRNRWEVFHTQALASRNKQILQNPVNSFRRSANATVIVSRSNVVYRFTPLSYFPSGDGEISAKE